MTTTNFSLRLDKDLRDKAFSVFESYGVSASQAFKLFLTQVAETNTIPLSFDYKSKVPNAVTETAIQEALARTDFSDAIEESELFKALAGDA